MPVIFGTNVTAGSYDKATFRVTATGEAFGINYYSGVSNIEVSKTGLGVWTAMASNVSWSDTSVVGQFSTKLASGTYDIRVTSSDGETDIATGAFKVAGGTITNSIVMAQRTKVGMKLKIGWH